MRIKEVAERSGFSAATLRYYEEIGLLPEAERTAGGYRSYGDATLARLTFIARAKQLGCTLEEITDLTTAWEGGRCGPIQDRLRVLVGEKIAAAQAQIIELMTLTSDLQRAAAALGRHRPDGPCDERCGCVTDSSEPPSVAISIGTKLSSDEDPAIACTLGAESLPGRLDDWHAVLSHATDRVAIDGGVRVEFGAGVPGGELLRIAAAEQECCAFLRFAATIDSRGVALEVTAPANAVVIVESLFGNPR